MKKYKNYFILAISIIAILVSICFMPINASRLIPVLEEQVAKELGVEVHIERLILRVGPYIKLKAPIVHLMYEDGQKFAQFNVVKFYVSWSSLFKETPIIKSLYSNKLVVRINSDDKYLLDLLDKIQKRDFVEIPDIKLREYNITYRNKNNNDNYILTGNSLELNKINNYKNMKIKTKGVFSINSIDHITYDLSVLPKIDFKEYDFKLDFINFIEQIKETDFKSDIIADLKLFKNSTNLLQGSGFINIDNISVLDPTRKDPKSFVYLTLWGDKASILSNIYTSNNKKVYIEGMLNNSRKPVIDVRVKTDEILLSELYEKIKIFSQISIFKDIEKITGKLYANFTLKGDLNKIKSTGFLKISDASIKANGLQIDKISSDIDFSNNVINIANAIGYVNNAPIMAKGHIDKTLNIELLMNKVELKYMCPEFLGVKSGVASLVANITGTFNNIVHNENLQIENFALQKDEINLSFDEFKIDTNKSNVANFTNVIVNNNETEPVKIPSLKMVIESENINIPLTNIYMPNSLVAVKLDITNYNTNDISFSAIANGYLHSKDIKKLAGYVGRYPLKLALNGNKFVQNANLQIQVDQATIFDEPIIVNLASKLEKNSIKIEDLSVLSFSGNLSDDFKANLKGAKKLIITGIIDNFKEPLMKNIRLFIPQQINLSLFDTVAQIKGDVFINGTFDKPEIVGQLNIINLFNQSTQTSLTNTTVDFNKNVAVLNAPNVKINDSTMSINTLLDTNDKECLALKNLNIKSKYLNTSTLLMYKDSPIIKAIPVKINDGKLYAEKVLVDLYNTPLYLTGFIGDIKLEKDLLNVKNISSEIYNGKLVGALSYNLKDEHYDSKLMMRGVSAAPIFSLISTRKDTISGVMDFDADLKGELTSKNSIEGDIKFIVNNGRMSTLGKLEHLLYAQNVIADNMLRTSLSVVTKAITLKDTGLFKFLRGEITLKNGIANIKTLQTQGPLMSLFIKGQYNPSNDYANLIVLGRLSDEVVSGLGVFGDFSFNKLMIMLTGEENKFNILTEDLDKLPQLAAKNTKEFRSIINGVIDKPASVIMFNWISYSQKSLKQREVPLSSPKLPSFVEELPY